MTTEQYVRMKHWEVLVSKMAEFRSNDTLCDINVIVGGETFRCHRVILSAASEYFEKMFTGSFTESSKSEVTLLEIEAYIFKEILNFIYNGNVEIRISNVYGMICAADFYNLPLVAKLCTEFVEGNLNVLAENILRIFSLAYRLGLMQLVELLRRHIHKNFCYFVKRPDFPELTVDSLMEVLNQIDSTLPVIVPQDIYFEGIYQWITHQKNLTPVNKKLYLKKLTTKIDFTKLSAAYTRSRMTRFIKNEHVELGSSTGSDVGACGVILGPTKVPFAYVSRNYKGGFSTGVSIFTTYLAGSINTSPQYVWTYSGELEYRVDFMRNVLIDDSLYSLRYLRKHCGPTEQAFFSGSSISMYPSLTLTPPPCILDEFDMSGLRNNIYVYNKNILPISNGTEYSGFSREEISRGMYVYKRDVDKWFPIPCPKKRFINACMTCDDEGIVYLIGGQNSHRAAQVYDPRTQGWSALPSTTGIYEGAACCAYGNKIYVAGGLCRTVTTEMYDSGNWKRLKDLPKPNASKFQLVNWNSKHEISQNILSFNRTLLANPQILCLNPVLNDSWHSIPNLFDAVKGTVNVTCTELSILDMVIL